jgi:hypothetical protein
VEYSLMRLCATYSARTRPERVGDDPQPGFEDMGLGAWGAAFCAGSRWYVLQDGACGGWPRAATIGVETVQKRLSNGDDEGER